MQRLDYTKDCTVLSFNPLQPSPAHWYHHLMIHALYSSVGAQLGTLNSVVKLINVLLPVISVLRSGVTQLFFGTFLKILLPLSPAG